MAPTSKRPRDARTSGGMAQEAIAPMHARNLRDGRRLNMTRRLPDRQSPPRIERSAFGEEMSRLPRSEWPRHLYLAWVCHEIDDATLREWILPTWELAEWPATLGHRNWLTMFAATGFVDDGSDAPPAPLTVYRGASVRHSRGFSWTWDLERARWFAQRTAYFFDLPAAVYEVTLPFEMLLGVIGGVEGRGEREVVVNPRRLRGRWAPRELIRVDPSDIDEEG